MPRFDAVCAAHRKGALKLRHKCKRLTRWRSAGWCAADGVGAGSSHLERRDATWSYLKLHGAMRKSGRQKQKRRRCAKASPGRSIRSTGKKAALGRAIRSTSDDTQRSGSGRSGEQPWLHTLRHRRNGKPLLVWPPWSLDKPSKCVQFNRIERFRRERVYTEFADDLRRAGRVWAMLVRLAERSTSCECLAALSACADCVDSVAIAPAMTPRHRPLSIHARPPVRTPAARLPHQGNGKLRSKLARTSRCARITLAAS